ncbi:hypothetical protein BCY91_00440 [Pelobium manganitolerans]|uniref:DUF1800 domain-containing protein n=1 Tax=Pelobium manganitolerans TaxID=1842495 RepID=A0A419SBD5_9SPHI|nr:DUF1800 domain-containing protein [Pelobium manganitolerans]RKD20129.1 hypothetical protein BCY91_00440 [Pelobium manganitolerans]
MRSIVKYFYSPFLALTLLLCLSSFLADKSGPITQAYRKAGLTDREAALHLLNRFTFGATTSDIDNLVKIGADKWFAEQLKANYPDKELQERLAAYDAINLSNQQVNQKFPRAPQVLRQAIKEGHIHKDSINKTDKKAYREMLNSYMAQKGYRPQQELYRQFISQKILRATYSQNQLQEVLTDFWFNHFNVSLTKNDCAMYIPAYERDVIRPNVFGKFSNLLLATAKSPAMLFFLDNFTSVGNNQEKAQATKQNNKPNALGKVAQPKKAKGLNENYAREVMELHTLGVDGGYTQEDVTQAARVLTGWTIYPAITFDGGGNAMKKLEQLSPSTLEKRGFVREGDFWFTPNRHDNGIKIVLGHKFNGGGYQEGVALLEMLAHHPSTAKFICHKLAVRFVSDNPPQKLVDNMVKTFNSKDGSITAILQTMVADPQFWTKEALGEKTKSPFELAISAARALDADVLQPYQLYTWINKMGQKIYAYQAPTGFPDRAQYWINTGALLNRMNFGLAIASGKIKGVKVDLAALNNNHEPESSEAALATYGNIILPERDLSKTIERLTPLLTAPDLAEKVSKAASKNTAETGDDSLDMDTMVPKIKAKANKPKPAFASNAMLAQVVGVIIGAPEFQKR